MPFFLGSSIGASLPTAYIQTTKGKSETTSIANHAVILVRRDDTEFLGRATTPHGTLRTCLVSQLVCSCSLVYIQTLVVWFVPLRYVHLFIHSFVSSLHLLFVPVSRAFLLSHIRSRVRSVGSFTPSFLTFPRSCVSSLHLLFARWITRSFRSFVRPFVHATTFGFCIAVSCTRRLGWSFLIRFLHVYRMTSSVRTIDREFHKPLFGCRDVFSAGSHAPISLVPQLI